MLDQKTYSRQELMDLFKTDRLDSIKSKLKRQNYQFTTSGRGSNFTLTITDLPPQFRNFCVDELGFAPQTDFMRLKKFLYRFFYDEEFQKLPQTEMERVLDEEGFYISSQTIGKWIQKLIDCGLIWRSFADFNYYTINHRREKKVLFIDKETYSEAWRAYWDGRPYSYNEACSNMYAVVKGTPHKVGKIIENVFGADKFDRLLDILESEKDIDE